MMPLQQKYQKEVLKSLKEKFGYKNVMAIPKIEKAVLNTSFAKATGGRAGEEERKLAEASLEDLSQIAGQKAVLTRARKSVAGFKLRQGMPIGVKVTLRGSRMYDFLDRLVNVVLPRSRDFRGLKRSSVDRYGNLTIGIREHIWFPEIFPEKVRSPLGLEITISTTAKSREEGLALLEGLGFPLSSE